MKTFKKYFVLCLVIFSSKIIFGQELQTDKLNQFIEKRRAFNKNSKKGYRVLIYNGNESKALKTRYEFKQKYNDIDINLIYTSPNWKVMTNTYGSKIEAERIYLIVKEEYANAKIL